MAKLIAMVLCSLTLYGVDSAPVDIPQVHTTSGLLHGSRNNHSSAFYGIPYAVPPIGSLRFQPPQMLNTSDVVRNVSVRREIYCPAPDKALNEDCLVLNVDVPLHVNLNSPESSPFERLPVLFYIHGGGFSSNSELLPVYDGRYLSQTTDTIIITINYRLGPLGFLVFDDGEHIIDGNQGLKDQQLAMQWIQNNIEKFGGDKSKVTIFGQSAGAQSVMFHLLSKTSKPLFHQAIMESNPAHFTYPTRTEALALTDKLVKLLRCKLFSFNQDCCHWRKDSHTCLMESSSEKLVSAMVKMSGGALFNLDMAQFAEPFPPYIDGVEFTMQPIALFKEGSWNKKKPIIIGTTKEELNVLQRILPLYRFSFRWMNRIIFNGPGKHENTATLISDKYAEIYPNITDYALLFGMELTDILFGCPTRAMARFASLTSKASVHQYIFDYSSDEKKCTNPTQILCGYSYHSSDVFFNFRTTKSTQMIPDEKDIVIMNQISTVLGNFAWTGNPSQGPVSLGEFPDWTRYTTKSYDDFATNIRFSYPKAYVEHDYHVEICDFWDSLGIYLAPPRVNRNENICHVETWENFLSCVRYLRSTLNTNPK